VASESWCDARSRLCGREGKYGQYSGLDGYGLDVVGRVALPVVETPHNVRYLRTKRERMHHDLVLATDAAGL
jgi:hypothetical protein